MYSMYSGHAPMKTSPLPESVYTRENVEEHLYIQGKNHRFPSIVCLSFVVMKSPPNAVKSVLSVAKTAEESPKKVMPWHPPRIDR